MVGKLNTHYKPKRKITIDLTEQGQQQIREEYTEKIRAGVDEKALKTVLYKGIKVGCNAYD